MTVEHLSVDERIERGRAARSDAPRRSHAGFSPAAGRPDPVDLLERQAVSRVQELVPIRYGRMLSSPFAFYRGAALIMAGDLAGTPVSGLRTQICGDAHLSNFGVFGTPERRLVFDLNDFDETLPGPWEWDVKRLAASLAVAGRENGFSPPARRRIVGRCLRRYRAAMARFASRTNLDVFYASLDLDRFMASYRAQMPKRAAARTTAMMAKARTRDSMQALKKLSHRVDGELRIRPDPPLIVPASDLLAEGRLAEFDEWIRARLAEYVRTLDTDRQMLISRYRMVDFARKVVGVGSVGTRAWIMLLLGRDAGDPLILQFKEAQPSVLEEFAGASEYHEAGRRVVAGQQLMQAAGDAFLGWLRVTGFEEGAGQDYYVRQLKDWKGSADIGGSVPKGLAIYAEVCGWTLARAHARSGDPVAISAYLGKGTKFDDAIASFAEAYADQNERDFAALQQAVADGRLRAELGA